MARSGANSNIYRDEGLLKKLKEIKRLKNKIKELNQTLKTTYDIDQIINLENQLGKLNEIINIAEKNKNINKLTDSKSCLNTVKKSQKQAFYDVRAFIVS